jgi:hypothetical protein
MLSGAVVSHVHITLARTLASDAAAGVISAGVSSPLICAMDRAMTISAAGQKPLLASLQDDISEMARNPGSFLTSAPFLWIWCAYGITYIVANVLSTLAAASVLSQLLATTAVNTVACIAKDAKFAQLYGNNPDEELPLSSYACFLARDITTMGFVFTLPALMMKWLPGLPGPVYRFSTPLLCQYFTTPLYLTGLACYNFSGGVFLGCLVCVDLCLSVYPSIRAC